MLIFRGVPYLFVGLIYVPGDAGLLPPDIQHCLIDTFYRLSWKRIHIHPQGRFEDDNPFPKVGHVSSLEGNYSQDDDQIPLPS